MIWERMCYNLNKQGMPRTAIASRLADAYGGTTHEWLLEDFDYAIELCERGPVPGYERGDC